MSSESPWAAQQILSMRISIVAPSRCVPGGKGERGIPMNWLATLTAGFMLGVMGSSSSLTRTWICRLSISVSILAAVMSWVVS